MHLISCCGHWGCSRWSRYTKGLEFILSCFKEWYEGFFSLISSNISHQLVQIMKVSSLPVEFQHLHSQKFIKLGWGCDLLCGNMSCFYNWLWHCPIFCFASEHGIAFGGRAEGQLFWTKITCETTISSGWWNVSWHDR